MIPYDEYPDPPEEEASDEFDLFKPIIDAFVAKYPAVEFGPCHIVFGDYNLEKHWLVDMDRDIGQRNSILDRMSEPYDRETHELLQALITICDLLGIE